MAEAKKRKCDMRALFAAIDACDVDATKQVVTCLEPDHLGKKCLIVDDNVAWMSDPESEFCKNPLRKHESFFCDTLGNEKRLVICGGGHVSIPVIRMGQMIGCHVTVLEDRPKFADAARMAGADEVYCEPFKDGLQKIDGDADTYFIIVTRGHRYDEQCLEEIVKKRHAYIGMIGSRRRVALVKEHLLERGCDKKILDEIYSPIGLNIGAETPEEIGVAIIAEIIEVKNKKKRTYGFSKEIRKAIETDAGHGRKVLATIIERKGSAPQGVGVKMLIFEDGTCVGTIGGGCMEAEVTRKARLILADEEESKATICTADLMNADAGEEGMVCGGAVKVLLEPLA